MDEVPRGCQITIVSDSCHSGGLVQDAEEQIGESTKTSSEGQGSGFGFKNFLQKTVDDALVSRGVHLPSKFRPHHRQEEDSEDQEVDAGYGDRGYMKSRSLPLSTLIDHLCNTFSEILH